MCLKSWRLFDSLTSMFCDSQAAVRRRCAFWNCCWPRLVYTLRETGPVVTRLLKTAETGVCFPRLALLWSVYMLISFFHWPALNDSADWWDWWKMAFEDAWRGSLALSRSLIWLTRCRRLTEAKHCLSSAAAAADRSVSFASALIESSRHDGPSERLLPDDPGPNSTLFQPLSPSTVSVWVNAWAFRLRPPPSPPVSLWANKY